jgi:hypothetical protein
MQGKVLFRSCNQGLDIAFSKSAKRDKEGDARIADLIDIRSAVSSAETGRKMEEERKNLDTVSKKPRHDISDKSLPSMKLDERAAVRRVFICDDRALASSSSSTHRSSAENTARSSEPSSSGRQESKDAAFPYRNPNGEKVRVWCRFGQNCRSGSSCRFGHEVIAQTQKSAKNTDLRDSIHSNTY